MVVDFGNGDFVVVEFPDGNFRVGVDAANGTLGVDCDIVGVNFTEFELVGVDCSGNDTIRDLPSVDFIISGDFGVDFTDDNFVGVDVADGTLVGVDCGVVKVDFTEFEVVGVDSPGNDTICDLPSVDFIISGDLGVDFTDDDFVGVDVADGTLVGVDCGVVKVDFTEFEVVGVDSPGNDTICDLPSVDFIISGDLGVDFNLLMMIL